MDETELIQNIYESKKPTFSIIVPVFNEEKFIHEALNSILAQTESNWEALLIDDGSTDSSPRILDDYAKLDPRFRVFHKTNGGQSSAINKGVNEANGEWICWLSGDDFFEPDKLELNKKWIKNYPLVGFFFSGYYLIQNDGKKIKYNLDWLKLENSAYHLITLFKCNYLMGISICIRTEAWRRNGGFNEDLKYAHDLDMWLRICLNTLTKYFQLQTCTMRYHAGQETAKFPEAPLFDSAKAAINILNYHSFEDLFPQVDLNNQISALQMLTRSMDYVAGDSNANYLSLGYHPLLQLRIMEWIWNSKRDSEITKVLINKYISKVADFKLVNPSNVPFTLIWKAIYAAIKLETPNFEYYKNDSSTIGESYYYYLRANQSETAQPLKSYLERFEEIKFIEPISNLCNFFNKELVLFLPSDMIIDNTESPMFNHMMGITRLLIQRGFSILWVGKSKNTFGMIRGIPFIGAYEEKDRLNLLTYLENVDILITFEPLQTPNNLICRVQKSIDLIEENTLFENYFSKLLVDLEKAIGTSSKKENKPRKITLLFQRVCRKIKKIYKNL